jgi:hypothetical protein
MRNVESELLDYKPLFVCGAPRTGTTLMSAIMSTSLQVNAFAAECEYLTSFIHSYVVGRDRYDIHTNCFFDEYGDFLRFQGNMIKRVLTHYWEALDKPSTLVLKDPGMTRYANLFLDFISDAKMIMMIRDPLDVVASRIQIELRRIQSDDIAAVADYVIPAVCQQYNYCYEFVIKQLNDILPRTLFVEYEAIAAGNGIDQLAGFSGLQDIELARLWQRRVTHWKRQTFEEWTSSLNGNALSEASVASHKSWLTPAHIERVNKETGSTYAALLTAARTHGIHS